MVLKSKEQDHSHEILNPSQEVKLASFVDKECGRIQSILIKRRLTKSFAARQFVDQLERCSQDFQEVYQASTSEIAKDLDLGDRVYRRIVQEERLSLLRSLPASYETERPFFGRFAWGAIGAVCASFVLLVMPAVFNSVKDNRSVQLVMQGQPSDSKLTQSDMTHNVNFNQADFIGEDLANSPLIQGSKVYLLGERELMALRSSSERSLDPQFSGDYASLRENNIQPIYREQLEAKRREISPKVVDVDWVRSSGRVKVLRDPQGRASILWVQKKQPSSLRYPQRGASPAAIFVSGK